MKIYSLVLSTQYFLIYFSLIKALFETAVLSIHKQDNMDTNDVPEHLYPSIIFLNANLNVEVVCPPL